MIRPREFEVDNGEGLKPDIRIDPESLCEGGLFFEVEQDDEIIVVNLACLRGLVAAAEELTKARPNICRNKDVGDPEPYCYHDGRDLVGAEFAHHADVFPLYRNPQTQRTQLTVPQVHQLDWPEGVAFEDILALVRAVEAAHGIVGKE